MIGQEIHNFAKELWPLNRSITGPGLRQTLQEIKKHIPSLKICSVPSGTAVFDWTVPKEWSVKKAYIVNPAGEKICDFSNNNLHVVGYSIPFQGKLTLEELQKYLHSIPEQPDAIPYVTSYYERRWGFCITHHQRLRLEKGEYEVLLDSELKDGYLDFGEVILNGKSEKEVFLSTYVCHPSMANNELSGPTVTTFITKWLGNLDHREFTYRIVFIPETIGSITYLSKHLKDLKKNVFSGFNISSVGDDRAYSYIPSRAENTISDKVALHVLRWMDPDFKKYNWLDRGSDERQYCAPGIDLPVATIQRSTYGKYPEYHTSLDNLENVVTPEGLNGGYWAIRRALEILENNHFYKVNVFGEPQLEKRGLYSTLSTKRSRTDKRIILDFLSYCDGKNSLLDIADKIRSPCWKLFEVVEILLKEKLITRMSN